MDPETGYQLLTTGDNKAKFNESFRSQPRLKQNEDVSCLGGPIKSLLARVKHYLAATASSLASLMAGDNQNSTWLTPIIDIYTWKTFHKRATLKLANWFDIVQIAASYIPLASVSLTTIPLVSSLGSQTENSELPSILDKMSNTYPEFKTIIYVSTIVWIIFTGFSVLHYFWKTKVRTANIRGFSMEHFFQTQLKLVAIGTDLSIVNTLIRIGTKWEYLPFLLIYILLIIVLTIYWLGCNENWNDKLLMEYFSNNNSDDIEVGALYKAYKKENPDEEHELPTITERVRNITVNANGDAQDVEDPGGEADQ